MYLSTRPFYTFQIYCYSKKDSGSPSDTFRSQTEKIPLWIKWHYLIPKFRKCRSKKQGGKKKRGEGKNYARRMLQAVRSSPSEEPAGQTCIPAAALQPELTPIRPPPALLRDRFQLCCHVTPTNYGRLTWNRLDCDLKLRFIFHVGW